jgi:hypothetical protein
VTGMQIAALVLVCVGCTGLVVMFVLMRRKLEQLRTLKDGER